MTVLVLVSVGLTKSIFWAFAAIFYITKLDRMASLGEPF